MRDGGARFGAVGVAVLGLTAAWVGGCVREGGAAGDYCRNDVECRGELICVASECRGRTTYQPDEPPEEDAATPEEDAATPEEDAGQDAATPEDAGGEDAGSEDAGGEDAGPEDAGPGEDAGPEDAGPMEDAGPLEDAGADASVSGMMGMGMG